MIRKDNEPAGASWVNIVETVGGVAGMLGIGAAGLIASGFVATRSHANMLGVSDIVIVPTKEYVYTGLMYVVGAIVALGANVVELALDYWPVIVGALILLIIGQRLAKGTVGLRFARLLRKTVGRINTSRLLDVIAVIMVALCVYHMFSTETPSDLLLSDPHDARSQQEIVVRSSHEGSVQLQRDFGEL